MEDWVLFVVVASFGLGYAAALLTLGLKRQRRRRTRHQFEDTRNNGEDYCTFVTDHMNNSPAFDVIRCGRPRSEHHAD